MCVFACLRACVRACALYGVAWQAVIRVGEGGGGGGSAFEGIDPAQERNDLEPLILDPRPAACIDMICMQVHMSGRQPTPSAANSV